MLEPVTTGGSRGLLEETREPIEYRLPAAVSKKFAPKKLVRTHEDEEPDELAVSFDPCTAIVPRPDEETFGKRRERRKKTRGAGSPTSASPMTQSRKKSRKSPEPSDDDTRRHRRRHRRPSVESEHPALKGDTGRGLTRDVPAIEADTETKSLTPVGTHGRKTSSHKSEESAKRNFNSKRDFYLTALGISVGVSSVWRFPAVVHCNGGATFLVAYAVIMVVFGAPLYYLEITIAQFCGKSALGFLDCSQIARGVGCTMIIYSWSRGVCYAVYMSYFLLYLFYAFYDNIPWDTCKDELDKTCFSPSQEHLICKNVNKSIYESYHRLNVNQTATGIPVHNRGKVIYVPEYAYHNATRHCLNATRSSAKAYLIEQMWQLGTGIQDVGSLNYALVVSLSFTWGLIFMLNYSMTCMKTQIHAMTLVMAFTMLLLIVYLLAFPGALTPGVASLLRFDEKISDPAVWREAAHQAILSLGTCSGLTLSIGTRCEYGENVEMEAIAVCCTQTALSVTSTIILYAMLGNLAVRRSESVEEMTSSIYEIGLVTATDVAGRAISPLILVTFYFVILIAAGLPTQAFYFRMCVEQITYAVTGNTELERHVTVLFVASVFAFAFGLPLATSGGMRIVFLVSSVINDTILGAVATLEVLHG
ncbi:sodium- and chloride-dependent glycine transporter 2-like isoform X2 [Ornithodoros turicata]|uniref:sodium- and chloride-dependent glycine transporter 2-like isoform X2 n=1 Tax=Ornithodoros turicata TaxID=34597 RepID=UPI00313A4677